MAIIAAVDHPQIPTNAPCPGDLRRLARRVGLANGFGGQLQQDRCLGADTRDADCWRLRRAGVG